MIKKTNTIILLLILLAIVLRLYGLTAYTLHGDEYFSIQESYKPGLNLNSIPYFLFMHFWIKMGESELWLRLPSVVCGVLAIIVLFKAGEHLGGRRAGIAAGLLAATSPFSIHHSQEMRFYTFFILTTAIFILSTLVFIPIPKITRSRMLLVGSGAVLLVSHFLGAIALYAQSASAWIASPSRSLRRTTRTGIAFGLLAAVFLLPLVPAVQRLMWSFYHAFGNFSGGAEPVTTPISLVSLAKMGFTAYTFTFGYNVYPLKLWIVIPGLLLVCLLLVAGCRKMLLETPWGMMPFAYALAVIGVFIVLDSVGGRVASGVAPRHVAFAFPAFLLVIAMGVSAFRGKAFHLMLCAMFILNISALALRWQGEWTTSAELKDHRLEAARVSAWTTNGTAILHDGRSKNFIARYFPNNAPHISYWPYLKGKDLSDLEKFDRLIFITNDHQAERRREFNWLLERLDENFSWVTANVKYPLFEIVLDRRAAPHETGYAVVPETNQIRHPLTFYGLEFDDLPLPIELRVGTTSLQVVGSFGLSKVNRERVLPVERAIRADEIALLSTVTDAAKLKQGEQIAEAVLESETGEIITLPVRFESDTQSWRATCTPESNCQTLYRWHKRISFGGQSHYPEAWRDFRAGLHGATLRFTQPISVRRVTLRYTANAGQLSVWGLALPCSANCKASGKE